ncbi:hypothetical protein RU94_GL001713 [Enterococcus asini]|nr:hypothetical protein RU94_GL001713 [Enterococcus asini]
MVIPPSLILSLFFKKPKEYPYFPRKINQLSDFFTEKMKKDDF